MVRLLKSPASLIMALGIAFLFFDFQYLMMSRMVGYENEMCVPGAGLTTGNILFSIVLALMAGALMVGFWQTLKERQARLGAVSASGIGAMIGTLTVFCPACSIPVLSAFGVAAGLTVQYNLWFKGVSFALMAYGLYQIDKQLKGTCERCID